MDGFGLDDLKIFFLCDFVRDYISAVRISLRNSSTFVLPCHVFIFASTAMSKIPASGIWSMRSPMPKPTVLSAMLFCLTNSVRCLPLTPMRLICCAFTFLMAKIGLGLSLPKGARFSISRTIFMVRLLSCMWASMSIFLTN